MTPYNGVAVPDPISVPPLRIAHLVRPAQGGMRQQVGALLRGVPNSLLAAPPEVLEVLGEFVSTDADRYALPETATPSELLRAGWEAGLWAQVRGATHLHGHGLRWAPLFFAASLSARLPLVVTLHNLVPAPGQASRRTLFFLRLLLSRARNVIAVSEAVAESARIAGIAARLRLQVVRNGVDLSRFDITRLPSRVEARQALNLPLDVPVALCVARLSPEKDVGCFLEAAALVVNHIPDARFLVAGDGPLRGELEQQVERLNLTGCVTLLGEVTDIPRLLPAANVFCLPSREEGLSLAAIEAMAASLPVIATRVGGLPEVVADGETGILVPPQDAAALADVISTLLTEPERSQRMGDAGRARAMAHFNEATMLSQTETVYAEALRT